MVTDSPDGHRLAWMVTQVRHILRAGSGLAAEL